MSSLQGLLFLCLLLSATLGTVDGFSGQGAAAGQHLMTSDAICQTKSPFEPILWLDICLSVLCFLTAILCLTTNVYVLFILLKQCKNRTIFLFCNMAITDLLSFISLIHLGINLAHNHESDYTVPAAWCWSTALIFNIIALMTPQLMACICIMRFTGMYCPALYGKREMKYGMMATTALCWIFALVVVGSNFVDEKVEYYIPFCDVYLDGSSYRHAILYHYATIINIAGFIVIVSSCTLIGLKLMKTAKLKRLSTVSSTRASRSSRGSHMSRSSRCSKTSKTSKMSQDEMKVTLQRIRARISVTVCDTYRNFNRTDCTAKNTVQFNVRRETASSLFMQKKMKIATSATLMFALNYSLCYCYSTIHYALPAFTIFKNIGDMVEWLTACSGTRETYLYFWYQYSVGLCSLLNAVIHLRTNEVVIEHISQLKLALKRFTKSGFSEIKEIKEIKEVKEVRERRVGSCVDV